MKLFRFDGGRIGVVIGDSAFDITHALGIDTASIAIDQVGEMTLNVR